MPALHRVQIACIVGIDSLAVQYVTVDCCVDGIFVNCGPKHAPNLHPIVAAGAGSTLGHPVS